MKREAEGNNNDDSISISSSRSSLASWDLALRQSFHKHVSIFFFPFNHSVIKYRYRNVSFGKTMILKASI